MALFTRSCSLKKSAAKTHDMVAHVSATYFSKRNRRFLRHYIIKSGRIGVELVHVDQISDAAVDVSG